MSEPHLLETQDQPATPKRDPVESRASTGARIAALARGSGVTQASFLEEALAYVAEEFESPCASAELRFPARVLKKDCLRGEANPEFWTEAVQSMLTSCLLEGTPQARLFKHTSKQLDIALLSAPIVGTKGTLHGALALVAPCGGEREARETLALLGPICSLIAFISEEIASGRATASSDNTQNETLKKAAAYASRTELAFAVTNTLRNKTGCDQIGLSLVRGKQIEILSISGLDEVRGRSPGVLQMQAAMEECRDARELIAFPRADGESKIKARNWRLHAQWSGATTGSCVASVPLNVDDRLAGVLSLRRSSRDPFDGELLEECRKLVEPYLAAVDLIDRAHQGLLPHARRTVADNLKQLLRPEAWFKKAMLAVGCAFALWFAFGKVHYQLTIPAQISPIGARHIAAPFDGVLWEASRVAGDMVEEGEILATLDTRSLELEREQLQADLRSLSLEESKALASGTAVDLQLARANRAQVLASLSIVEAKIVQAVIRAPFAGMLVSGDLRDREGQVITKGEPLFQVSRGAGWRLELFVPEADADEIDLQQSGEFSSQARPELSHAIALSRLSATAQIHAGRNVYVAEATTDIDSTWVRSGMAGIAKVDVGERRVWWVALHRFVDAARLLFWI